MIFIPDNQQQADAYYSEADELFFGGKAGTGKSYLALGLAATQHWNSVIFRREFSQHKGGDGLISKAIELVGDGGVNLNRTEGIYKDVFGGRTIEFAGLRDDKDVSKQKGRARDLYAFDEITEFSEDQFLTVIAWLRSTKKGQRKRIVLTGNPPTTPEGEWVVRRYAAWLDPHHRNPAKPGELRWYANVDGEEIERKNGTKFKNNDTWIRPKSRTFIPGEMVSYLEQSGYKDTLQNLPEMLRRKLLDGDFNVKPTDDLFQVIPSDWIEAAQKRWIPNKPDAIPMTCLGADIGRGGDKTVIARRYGSYFSSLIKVDTLDGPTAFMHIKEAQEDDCLMGFDPIGIGASVYDIMDENRENFSAINFATSSNEKDKSGKYKLRNKRAECYWKFGEALDPKSDDPISLPPDRELFIELRAPRYKITTQGITIEPKEDIKKRIGHSPDSADAVVIAWAGAVSISYLPAPKEQIQEKNYTSFKSRWQ